MLEFDFSANAVLLFLESVLEPLRETVLHFLQLLLVVVASLLESLGEGADLGFLAADGFLQLFRFALHLALVGSFLDVRVVPFQVLTSFFVHLLQPITLSVRVRPGSRRPVDVVNLGKGSFGIFDRPDDFAELIPCATETHWHTLSVEPSQYTSKYRIDSTQGRESDTRTLLIRRKTSQSSCDQDL